MKFKKLFFILVLAIFFSSPSYAKRHDQAREDHEKHDHSKQEATATKVGKEKLVIKVKGMVCAFCAQGIKKNFNKLDEVKSTNVDLDTMEVTVQLKPETALSEKTIEKVVTGAGFSFVGVK